MHIETKECRLCDNSNLVSILNLGEHALTGVFPSSPQQKVISAPVELVKCHAGQGVDHCGLVQMRHTVELSGMYGLNYGYRSSLNRTMVNHLSGVIASLRQQISLKQDDFVIDIGSNDGTSLSFYPEGCCTLVGVDPTAAKFRQYYRKDILVIPDFFSRATIAKHLNGRRAKIITSIAMFYDLPRPMDFVRDIHQALAEDGLWFFEQSYLPLMLKTNAYDTACHEHLEYYALRQIQWMLERCEMKVLDVTTNDVNGGSFAVTAARSESPLPVKTQHIEPQMQQEKHLGLDTLVPYQQFAQRVEVLRRELVSLLQEYKRQGKRVFGYGASTKGNVILQHCGITPELLPYIAEVNADKFGCFTPGTHIPIISESQAKQMKPDAFLVLPWHFRQNLLQREAGYLQSGGRMIFPMPDLEIVSIAGVRRV